MARPKKNAAIAPAEERIVEAFWTLLAEHPYKDITIARLSAQANINHNTFYYHFKNIDELAIYSYNMNLLPEIPQAILETLNLDSPESALAEAREKTREHHSPEELNKRLTRAALFARDDMVMFRELYGRSIIDHWLSLAGKSLDDLSDDQRVEMAFIIGGLINSINIANSTEHPERYTEIIAKHLGPGIYCAMADFISNNEE